MTTTLGIAVLGLAVFSGLSVNASACALDVEHGVYTEIALPCDGSRPDESQAAAMNQASQDGGECRVTLPAGDAIFVSGSRLLYSRLEGDIRQIGELQGKPSCYQTDNDEFYSAWVSVRLTK